MSVVLHDNGDGTSVNHLSGEAVDYVATSFTFRSGVLNNDVAYFVYMAEAGNATTTTPSGWTQIYAGAVGNFTPPAGTNPFRVEVWQKVCNGTESLTTVTWHGNGNTSFSNFRSGYAVMRGVDASYHIETQGSTYLGGFNENWGFGARANGDAFLGFFWDDIPGGPGTFTYPPEATGSISMGWYRIHSQTTSVPGGYTGTSDNVNTYPDYSDPTVGITLVATVSNVGSAAGTATAAAVGTGIKNAVGAAAGTTPTAVARSGVLGLTSGTSTALATSNTIIGAVGASGGAATAVALTGLRQAVGNAAGTSTAASALPLAASRRTTLDHLQSAIDRLPEYAKEAAHA